MDIMALDSSGYSKPISSCNINSLVKNVKTSCGENSLYSLINNKDEDKIGDLYNKFNKEITNLYRDFSNTNGPLIDKSSINSKCTFSDRKALQVSNSVKAARLSMYIENNRDLLDSSPGKSLAEILFSSKDTDSEHKEFLLSDPYFRQILEMKDINKELLSSLPSSLVNDPRTQDLIAKKLAVKCRNTYESAVTALCKSNKNASILSYKDARSDLRSKNKYDIVKQTQYLGYLCNEPDIKDISINIEKMNNSLPPSQKKQKDAKTIAEQQYDDSYAYVRKTVCEFIPKQVASFKEGLEKMGCTNGSYNEDCLYLETYAKLFPEDDIQIQENIASLSENSKNSKKKNNSNSLNRFSKPSSLVAGFIGAEIEEKDTTETITQEIKENENDLETETNNNKEIKNLNVTKKSQQINTKRVKQSRSIQSNKVVENKSYTSNPNNTTPSNKNTSIESKDDNTEMNDFYKGLAEKIRRSKNQNKYESKSISSSKNLLDRSKRNLNKAKEIMRNIASAQDNTFKSNGNSDLDTNYQNDEDIQKMINDQMHADSNFGSSSNYNPSKGNSSKSREGYNSKLSSESIEKGYAYQNIFGDTITKQGIEANYIDNKGFQGEIIGDKALEFVFLGELEQDPDKINLDEILTLDNSKGNIDSLIASIDTGKPFFIRSASSPNERILVKPSGGDFEFIKFSDDDSREFNKFYRKVKKAFKKKFYAKTRSKNSVVSASGY